MNRLIRLSPTGIEYGDYAWNFASGCDNHINGKCKSGDFNCWAYSITQRFSNHYPNGFKPTIYPDALVSPVYLKKPSRILCAFMGDLFCNSFNPDEKIEALMPSRKVSVCMSLKGWLYTTITQCPQHTFIFLTKQPQNLIKYSPFFSNCWVGVSATNQDMYDSAVYHLNRIDTKVKFISLEPLLSKIHLPNYKDVDWIIIGSQAPYSIKTFPKWEWVKEIIEACDKTNVPVFLKNNLRLPKYSCEGAMPFYKKHPTGTMELRQEFPNVEN